MRHGAFEDLLVMPGDVHDVYRRLERSRYPKRLTRERVDRPARLVPGDIQSGHADPPVLGAAGEQQVHVDASTGQVGGHDAGERVGGGAGRAVRSEVAAPHGRLVDRDVDDLACPAASMCGTTARATRK